MIAIEGELVQENICRRGRVEIGEDGVITGVGAPTGSADLLLGDELIFPGFIDLHVHARESVDRSWNYKEDFNTAGAAAINGGVVAFADMPNNSIPPTDQVSYSAKAALTKQCPVEVLLYAGIGPNTQPLPQSVPYKLFMGKSVGDLFFSSREKIDDVLEKYQGQCVSFHCEDPEILSRFSREPVHERQRPPEGEIFAVEFALELIKKYRLRGKICHCSTAQALEKIIQAKRNGVAVTVEVAPHHLYFDESMITERNHKMFQVNPPIRQSKENRLKLIAALKNGEIDYLATDHAPHTISEKLQGVSGMPHLDTYGPFASWLINEHKFTPQEILRVCSYNPGKFYNQFSTFSYGQITPGFAGSLTILATNKPFTVEKATLKTKCAWSPFEGITFPGRSVYTIVKGKIYAG